MKRSSGQLIRRVSGAVVLAASLITATAAGADTTRSDQDRWFTDYPGRAGTYEVSDSVGEASGVVASRQYQGIYWLIQDSFSGVDRRQITAIRVDHRSQVETDGTLLDIRGSNSSVDTANEIQVTNASNRDWEALAIDTRNRLWIADSGANGPGRTSGFIYVVDEPDPWVTTSVRSNLKYEYTFPGRSVVQDVEAMFSIGDTMYLVTKTTNAAEIYRVNPVVGQATDLTYIASLATRDITRVTGADLSHDGREFVMSSQRDGRAYVWRNDAAALPTTTAGADDLVRRYAESDPTWVHYFRTSRNPMQVEGIAISPPSLGRALTMVAEGPGKHVLYVRSGLYMRERFGVVEPPPGSAKCTATRLGDGRYLVKWDEKDAVARYVVYRSVNGLGPWWRGMRFAPAKAWRDDKNIAPANATVVYKVDVKNAAGDVTESMTCTTG